MGQVLTRLIDNDPDAVVVAGFDINTNVVNSYPVFKNPEEFTGFADVIIDFSHPSCLSQLLLFAQNHKIPAVISTTGLSQDDMQKIKDASLSIPVFFSANMSLGVNLIIDLVKRATRVLEHHYDIEIIEKHHNQKIDAPSGTALAIADAISSTMSSPASYVYDRHAQRKKRDKNEIGMHSVRGGSIVGEHEVIFAGNNEIIEIKHTATSKEVFAQGAIAASKFLSIQSPGLYNMDDLVRSF
jgi:4-hydroxy-tetrahydrodipicolinate reductase